MEQYVSILSTTAEAQSPPPTLKLDVSMSGKVQEAAIK